VYEKILVPTDGSATAILGLREAIKLARCHGARIRLVHVVDEAAAAAGIVMDRLRSGGESILKDAVAAVRDAGLPVDSKLLEAMGGQAGAHIVQEAQAWSADLIVCGTHGRRGIRRAVMGSGAEYVVRHSAVPVLLVPSCAPAAKDRSAEEPL
jgi:nucleotide-binding universal stress UspA family protein